MAALSGAAPSSAVAEGGSSAVPTQPSAVAMPPLPRRRLPTEPDDLDDADDRQFAKRIAKRGVDADEDDDEDVLRPDRWVSGAKRKRGLQPAAQPSPAGRPVSGPSRRARGLRVEESDEDDDGAEGSESGGSGGSGESGSGGSESGGSGGSGESGSGGSESGGSEGSSEEEEGELPAEAEADVEVGRTLRVPASLWAHMFDHQREGLHWLARLHEDGVGGIVGDDMGLGKTLQTVSLLAALHTSRCGGPVLVACPATILKQWVRELHRWFPPIRASILHDCSSGGKARTLQQRLRAGTTVRAPGDVSVVVTTYEGVRIHVEALRRVGWLYVILDEGHKIRNPSAEVTLACKSFPTGHRLILSGSPIQNNLTELWSLLDFCFPGKLGSLPVFTQQFAVPISRGSFTNASHFDVQAAYQCSLVLRDLIGPHLLRRLKTEVAAGRALPPKTEHVLFCSLTAEQTELYERFLASDVVSATLAGRTAAFAALIALQKICNHPHLFAYSAPPDAAGGGSGGRGGGGGGGGGERAANRLARAGGLSRSLARGEAAAEEAEDAAEEEAILATYEDEASLVDGPGGAAAAAGSDFGDAALAGKLRVLQQVLRVWCAEGHRVLLFAQTKQMLDVLQIFARSGGYAHRRLDGSTPIGSRIALIDEFNRDTSIFLMLLTTRAGGLGVNLTGADRVVLYDPDWNPANDAQARERAWRIGQQRAVTVYRLVSVGTIEEKVFHRQVFKQLLSNKILKDPKQRRLFRQRDLKDLFARPPPVPRRDPAPRPAAQPERARRRAAAGSEPRDPLGDDDDDDARAGLPDFDDEFTAREMVAHGASDPSAAQPEDGGQEGGARRETQLLRQLLEGQSGVRAAVNHDAVLGDEVTERLTREEAVKIAQRAASLVRASGEQVREANWAEPAARLTGSTVPRFGRARPAAPPTQSAPALQPGAAGAAGAAGQSSRIPAAGVSSSALLAQIRSRQLAAQQTAAASTYEPESFAALGSSLANDSTQQSAGVLLAKLRAHFVRNGGVSSTTQIIGAFERHCDASNVGKILFRELLRQVAVQSGSEWRLRA